MSAYIIGSGSYLPDGIVTNEELGVKIGLTDEQIFKSCGIRQRRWAAPGTKTSTLAVRALELALVDAGIANEEIDYLIFGTMTPDRFIPGSSPAVQAALGLRQIPCLDIRAACCNALYGLNLASALIQSGSARNVAVCLAEVQSSRLDLSTESAPISMLFGDGAAALIVSQSPKEQALRFVDVFLATNGSYIDDLGIRRPGTEFQKAGEQNALDDVNDFAPRMNGQAVILQASRRIVTACKSLLERNGLSAQDVRWVVPHQANANLLAQVSRGLGLNTEHSEVITVLEDSGNTSSASMGIALDVLHRSGRIQPNDYLLMPAFAAGFTWGAALYQAVPLES